MESQQQIEMLAETLRTARVVRKMVINGITLEYDERGFIYWSNNWGKMPQLCADGFIRAVHGGPGTYGHTDYFVDLKTECEHDGQLCPECDGFAYEMYLESRRDA